MPMRLLDKIREHDRGDMLKKVMQMPEHFAESWHNNRDVALEIDPRALRNLAIVGMGGSAIAGNVLSSLYADKLPLPLHINRDYALPGWIGADSLVLLSSYSGNTEETLAAYRAARERRAKIIAITSGGELLESALAADYPVYRLPHGYPPRSALVFLTIPLLQVLSALGLVPSPEVAIEETITKLTELRDAYAPENTSSQNIALILTEKVIGKIPIIYAGAGLLAAAALRWRGQFSENTETLAFHHLFPELNHNEIVGWGQQNKLARAMQVIYLRDRDDHPRTKRRMEITREIIEQSSNEVAEIWSEGESRLARLFSVIFTGDLTSIYAAVMQGIDPTPVKKIDHLKQKMAKSK